MSVPIEYVAKQPTAWYTLNTFYRLNKN